MDTTAASTPVTTSSSPSKLLEVITNNAPPVSANIVRPVNALITFEFTAGAAWPPSIAINPLAETEGFADYLGRYSYVEVQSLTIELPRIPGADYEIAAAIVPTTWNSGGKASFTDLVLVEGAISFSFRASNTAVDRQNGIISFPLGVSRSLISNVPGVSSPALAIAISKAGTTKPSFANDATYYGYVHARLECSGHAFLNWPRV